jgi:death on curing protein
LLQSTAKKLSSTSVTTDVWYPIVADVLALHEALMRWLGENPAPLMAGGQDKLASAIASPEWAGLDGNADLAEQAALLAIRIAQAHAFIDNNKRVAHQVGYIFLWKNGGHILSKEKSSEFARWLVRVIEHRATVTEVAAWLRQVME